MSKQESWEALDPSGLVDASARAVSKTASSPTISSTVDHASAERRTASRLNLDFETAVPVLVRSPDRMHWGLARNISESGMLIQMQNPPPMGTRVDITLTGVRGSEHNEDNFELCGDVRHHLAWNYKSKGQKRAITAIGVRFCAKVPQFNSERGGWVH
jgi:hypothetical protein